MIDENLTARIYTVDKDGHDRVGTGYPVTPNLLITALHVVDYPEIAQDSEIEVVWPECDAENIQLTRKDVIYKGGENEYDLALVKCKTPLQANLPLSQFNPAHNSNFICRGYPLASLHKTKPKHDALRFSGNTEGNHKDAYLELTTNTTVIGDAKELNVDGWSGLSGAPVIVNDKLAGVISTKYKTVEKRLFAVSLPHSLKHCSDFVSNFVEESLFEEKIIEQITKTLSSQRVAVYTKVLREELNYVLKDLGFSAVGTEPADIAKGLVEGLQKGGKECLVINNAFAGAMFRCFDQDDDDSIYDQAQSSLIPIEKSIDKILGYLVLSLVNPADAKQLTSWMGEEDLSKYYFELHVRTLGGVELFVSYQQQRQASIDLDSKGQGLCGKHIIFHTASPFSWSDEAKLKETQLAIWNVVKSEEGRSNNLTSDELNELESIIKQRTVRRRDQEHYCLVLEFEEDDNSDYTKSCAEFLSKLKIPMVRYKVPGGGEPFHGQEHDLMAAIADFLENFNEFRTV